MLELLVFFYMESCNVDWQVHTHSAVHCEVERLDAKCELKVSCHTGRSHFDAKTETLIQFTEEAILRCSATRPNQTKSTVLRVESETWAVLACKKRGK